MMDWLIEIVQNKWFDIIISIFMGIIIGSLLIKPVLQALEYRAIKQRRPYVARFFDKMQRISFIIGIAIFLNILRYIPLGLDLKNNFQLSVKILDIIIVTYVFAEVLVFIYEKYASRRVDHKVSSIFHILIRILIYTAGILTILNLLNYDVKVMLTSLGVGGLAIALALQDTLGNLFAGFQILASKQLKPGDYVKVEESVEGYVLDINWRNTTLRTRLENVIIVPNSKIAQSITTNYFTLQKSLYFKISVGVHYDSDLAFVEKVTLEVAEQVLNQYPDVPKDFHSRVRFYEFADSSINFYVWMATDNFENQFVIKHHFIKDLHKRFNKEGIVIPFPIRTLYLEKEDKEALLNK